MFREQAGRIAAVSSKLAALDVSTSRDDVKNGVRGKIADESALVDVDHDIVTLLLPVSSSCITSVTL